MTVDLNPDPDVLFKAFTSAHRQDIRGGYKKGLTAKIGGRELLDDFYAVLSESWRDMGTPIYSRRYLETVADDVSATSRDCASSTPATEPAAAAFDMLSGDTAEGLWLGSRAQVPPRSTRGYVLYWELIKNACERGLQAIPPRAIDDAVRRRGVQEEVERVPDPAVLAVHAAERGGTFRSSTSPIRSISSRSRRGRSCRCRSRR